MRAALLALLLALFAGCGGDGDESAVARTTVQTATAAAASPDVLREFRPYPGARLVDSTARNRLYELPAGIPGALVQQHYERQFRGWEHRDEARGRHVDGHTVFIDYFWRGGRCVWLDVGVGAEGSDIAPKRTMSIWTAVDPRSNCI